MNMGMTNSVVTNWLYCFEVCWNNHFHFIS